MWQYEKKLQYPVNIKTPNPKLAKVIISQLGGLSSRKICFFQITKNPPPPEMDREGQSCMQVVNETALHIYYNIS